MDFSNEIWLNADMTQSTQIIDGKAFAAQMRAELKDVVSELHASHGLTPGLATVLVGDNPASEVYVRNKGAACREMGMQSFDIRLPETTTQAELLHTVGELNANPLVHGILVQLPLPEQISAEVVINAILPEKDVDGFHILNAGKLLTGLPGGMVPCTPLGCLLLLRDWMGSLAGKHAVIVGRSNIVGKPMALLLLQEHCTVTICHSRSADVKAEVQRADIVIAAVGRAKMVQGDWLKPGAVVLDVGINREDQGDGTSRLVGDVDFDAAQGIAAAITPVPGGIGPMTIACLLRNTVQAACLQQGLPVPFN